MDHIAIIISFIFLFGIGIFIGITIGKMKLKEHTSKLMFQKEHTEKNYIDSENRLAEKEKKFQELQLLKEDLQKNLIKTESNYQNLKIQFQKSEDDVKEKQKQLQKDFELLANKILDEKSQKFTRQNQENIELLLNPLQEKIKSFEEKVEKSQKESISMHASLREQLLGLKDLNTQMSKEANNLTKALKGEQKTQGNWGELVLENVLEKSGLEKNREYFVQQNFINNEGQRLMPDVVIHLPGNKKMIIDSKVSLKAYELYVNSNDEDEKNTHLKNHLISIKQHVDGLSQKKYQDIYETESPDFVLMFVPIEPAFAVAVNKDHSLYNKAFEKNIVIVTPTTLLATLRTIDTMWNNEKQQQNALEIARQAGGLYSKFVALTDDLLKVGRQLKTVEGSYNDTMKKLTGKDNLINKVERLKKLGVKTAKHIDEKLLHRAQED